MTKFPFYPPDKARQYENYSLEYKFDVEESTPWKPVVKELRHCKFCLITTAACRLTHQPIFKIDKQRGTAEYREISVYCNRSELVFDWAVSDLEYARRDLNVINPADRFLELAQEGVIGGLAETFLSFCGFCQDTQQLKKESASAAKRLEALGVDIAVIFSATQLCNQTAGLIARELEKGMISTIALITIKEVSQELRIPRSVFINFPFGMILGQPFATALQKSIVTDTINALKTLDKPGKILELAYKWPGR